jgi:RNA polymerase sigma factor (sigma-70 family)
MTIWTEEFDFETALAGQHTRLVRLCAWFTGRPEAAEDLAQEALIAAWKNREQLISPEKLQPWTSAIARNICLSWSRGKRHEQAHLAGSADTPFSTIEDDLPDDVDLEVELDRRELAVLLDRALSLLPPETGQMLIEHYFQESSHAEIGAKMNLKPGTVAVRLQRGKLTLQKLLKTHLKEESLAFGLIRPTEDWQETNIWCLNCGHHRLLGRFQKDELFALRCPQCDPEPHQIMVGMDLSQPYYAKLLGSAKTYKPAYTRLLAALTPLYRQALGSHDLACPECGQLVHVHRSDQAKLRGSLGERQQQIHLSCPACGWASNKTLSGLVMGLPEVQKFWREYPRSRISREQAVEVRGTHAFLTRIHSMTCSAELCVISKQDSFEPLDVHTNVPL